MASLARSTSLMTVENNFPAGWCWKNPIGCLMILA